MNQERSEREEWGDEGWEFDQLSADLSTALARIDELKGDLRELRENVLLGLGMTAEDVAEMDDDSMEPSIAFLLSGHQEVVAQLAVLKAAGEWRPVSEAPVTKGRYLTLHFQEGEYPLYDIQHWHDGTVPPGPPAQWHGGWTKGDDWAQPAYWRPLPAPPEATP